MFLQLLDQLFVWFAKLLSYIAVALILSLWSLVFIAIVANIYKLIK
jgi:hypothetical protein